MKTIKRTVNPMKGVCNPDRLADGLRRLKAGDMEAKSYIKGSLQVLERHPPNKLIVPVLRKALEKFG